MEKGKWNVQTNYIFGLGKRYIAYRVIDPSEVIHSGNIEHYGEYSENLEEVQKIVDELNQKEEVEGR